MNSLASGSTKARFVITSDTLSPQAVSIALGVEPSKVWLRGEVVHPKAINVHKQNGWSISVTSEANEIFLERTVDRLLKLVPAKAAIAFCRDNQGSIEVELSLIVHIPESGPVPSVALSTEQVRFLADCHGSLDVDIYR